MAKFESDEFSVAQSNDVIAAFLSQPKNLIEILPQDRIDKWKSDDTRCSFQIKGLAHISLKLVSSDDQRIVYASDSEKPFSFELVVSMQAAGNITKLSAFFDADVNAFMGTMLKSPLSNFLNSLGEAIKRKYEPA